MIAQRTYCVQYKITLHGISLYNLFHGDSLLGTILYKNYKSIDNICQYNYYDIFVNNIYFQQIYVLNNILVYFSKVYTKSSFKKNFNIFLTPFLKQTKISGSNQFYFFYI